MSIISVSTQDRVEKTGFPTSFAKGVKFEVEARLRTEIFDGTSTSTLKEGEGLLDVGSG